MSSLPSYDHVDPKIPPSISDLFHTNSVPSMSDIYHIHQLLAERKETVAAFTADIERARAQVRHLEHQRKHVQGIVQELEGLLSPARRVPMDIMAKVFEHCVWDDTTESLRPNPLAAPLVLAQVCRSWRYLLFSLPCLWTALQLEMPSNTKDWEALVQSKSLTMHVWFSRSKALPISLSLSHPKGSTIPWPALGHLDKEILSLGCRLKDLSLQFSPRSISSLLTFTQSPLPHLQHLELQNTNALPTSENPPPIALHSAPMLKSLSLSWCTIDLRNFHLPWAQLQHLNLNYDASSFWNPIHSDYLQTLALCPNLTTLFLGIGSPISGAFDPTSTTPVEPVTLPHVHTFKTGIYLQTTYLAHLFDTLRMPQLRHFEIKNVSLAVGSFTGHTDCLPLLARCGDTLESVSFNRVDMSDEPILSCLEQLDHLRTLSFMPGVLRLNHGLISALAGDDGDEADANGVGVLNVRELLADGNASRPVGRNTGESGPGRKICPVLESLHLRCSSIVSVDAIERLVASRRQTEPQLKQLALQLVTFEYGLDMRDGRIKEVQARLRPYVEDGLELTLTKSTSSNCGSALG